MRFLRIALTSTALMLALMGRCAGAANCLKQFKEQPQVFERCKHQNCFIFLSEPPYIMLDKRMKYHEDSTLFPCSRPRDSTFEHLHGSAFEIMAASYKAVDALCVWGGPDCQFNEMVEFIDEQARESPSYKFGATGLLKENKRRLTENVIQSTSLMREELAIFGKHQKNRKPFPVTVLVRPFRRTTWLAFVLFIAAVGVSAVFTARVFGPRAFTVSDFVQYTFHFFMDPQLAVTTAQPHLSLQDSADKTPSECDNEERRRTSERFLTYKAARHLMRVALSAMIVIFLLFYEVAVVNFLFIEQSAPKVRSVKDLTEEDLMQYSVEKKAATEVVWHRTVFKPGKYNPKKPPWKRCKDLNQCFDWALDPEDPVKFVVGFKSAGVYQVTSRHVCQHLTNYETQGEGKLYSFGAGWLYNSHMEKSFTRALDKEILDMHEMGMLPRIIEASAGLPDAEECRSKIADIDVGVIGASVVLLVVPPLLLIFAIVVLYIVKIRWFTAEAARQRERQEQRRQQQMRRLKRMIDLEGFHIITKPPKAHSSGNSASSSLRLNRAHSSSNSTSAGTLRLNGVTHLQSI